MRPLLERLARGRRWLRRRVLRRRRLLAALALGAAALCALSALRPAPPRTVTVWTARQDLPAGTVLAADDLVQVGFRPGSVPRGVVASPAEVAGATLAGPLSAGEPVLPGQVVGGSLLAGHPGTVAVPVRVTDPDVVALLRTGDRVSLTATDPQSAEPARTVATDVGVLAVPRQVADPRGSSPLPGRLVVVAVDPALADEVAAAAARDYLSVAWSR